MASVRRTPLLVALATVALFPAAMAQGQPAPGPTAAPASAPEISGVTVTAQKPNPTVSSASEFVRLRMPESPVTGQYSRFAEPICAWVQGLPPQFNTFIEKRIISLAKEVGAPTSRSPISCTPNLQVIFTPYPEKLLFNVGRRREMLLGFHYQSQYKRLTTWSRPVQAYYVTRTRGTYGQASFDVANGARSDFDPKDAKFGGSSGFGGFGPHGRAGSRLGADMSSDIAFTLVLGDAKKVAQNSVGEIADYIAVLALTPWHNLEHCNAQVDTILNLMADGCGEDPPHAVTPADLALLKALYTVNARESGSQQRMEIAAKLSKVSTEPSAAH